MVFTTLNSLYFNNISNTHYNYSSNDTYSAQYFTLPFTNCVSNTSPCIDTFNTAPKPQKKNTLRDIFPSKKVEIKPSKVHTVKSGENISSIAALYNVSPTRIKNANAKIADLNKLKIGQTIKIPESAQININKIKTVDDIVEATGISKNYINDFMMHLEVDGVKNIYKAYDDNVKDSGKSTLTIGYGHTGKVRGKAITKETKISKQEALQLLAVDLFNSKIEAIAHFGDDFIAAPKSVQEGIIDNFYNKGWDPGFSKHPTNQIGYNLKKKNYVMAAQNLRYNTTCKGLQKRILYRIIASTRSLTPQQRLQVLRAQKHFYDSVIKQYKGAERSRIVNAWNNALNGKCSGFFD